VWDEECDSLVGSVLDCEDCHEVVGRAGETFDGHAVGIGCWDFAIATFGSACEIDEAVVDCATFADVDGIVGVGLCSIAPYTHLVFHATPDAGVEAVEHRAHVAEVEGLLIHLGCAETIARGTDMTTIKTIVGMIVVGDLHICREIGIGFESIAAGAAYVLLAVVLIHGISDPS